MELARIYSFAARCVHTVRTLVVDSITPPLCAYCRAFMSDRQVFCDECVVRVAPVVSARLEVTATKEIWVFAVSAYKDPLKTLILAKGHSDIVAARQLGQLIWDMTYIRNIPFDYIVAIPAHWSRSAQRGFNQSLEMARVIAKASGKPVVQPIKRTKRTQFQATLNKNLRAQNVQEAFEVCRGDWSHLRGKQILIVDDLLTTGATIKEVARQLYVLKPASISAVVACRVV